MLRRLAVVGVLALAVFLVGASSTWGQAGVSTAQISGTIRDEKGGVMPKAAVSLHEMDTNRTYSTVANDVGLYVFANVPPGRYDLKVSATGFAGFTQKGIVLTVAQQASVDVVMNVASKGEEVIVTTEAPAIEPTKTELSQVIETHQIDNLPINGRLFTDFALLTPSVTTSRTSLGTTFTDYETTQISFGGQRSFNNLVTVDGADFVNLLTGVQRSTPPQESVQEFRVVNNSFGAEYGRALGGIVNIVTKSGTNDYHGSLYEYFQNDATDARSLLQPAPAPNELRQNQFGATFGGPIQKDKVFFFMNYDGKRRAESPTYAPSLFNNINELDAAKAYLGLSPEGCYQPLAKCTNTPFSYLNSVLKTNNNDYGFAKLDYQINSTNQVAVRYNIEDSRNAGELIGQTEDGGGVGTPSGARNLFVRDQSLFGTLTTQFKPTLINTFLLQYARRHYNFPGATGEPDLSVVNDLEFGHNFGTFDAIYESRVQFGDSLVWVKGKHIAKFGFDGNYVLDRNNYPGFEPERILFSNLDCLVTFANYVNSTTPTPGPALPALTAGGCPLPPQADGVDFLYWGTALPRTGFVNGYVPAPPTGGGFGSGWPNAIPTNMVSNFDLKINHGYFGFYAQDQWRVTPKLTLNYGLRWDFESGLGNYSDSDYTAFAPRVGLAYSPDSKTVIRAGFGMFFDRNNQTFYFVTGNQKIIPGYLCNPPGADPACAANGFTGGVVAPQVQTGSATGGWQLNALPGFPGTPALPCGFPGLPPANFCNNPQGTVSVAALTAIGILANQPYNPVSLTGPCVEAPTGALDGACGVGAGGIQRNGRLPYAEQASLGIDRTFGKGFTLSVSYLFVGAHKLVRGNNLNVPCPLGTDKPNNPVYAQGLLNPNGTQSQCAGTPTLGPFGLGPFFSSLTNPSGLEFGVPGAPGAATLSAGLLDFNNNVVNANYHGLTATVVERYGRVFTLTANYTYSHSIDNGNFTTFINLPVNQFDYNAERANSNQDVRHHFVANFTASGPDDTFVRQFTFSSIITLQSGRPFTLFSGQNTFGDVAGLSTDRVGGAPITGTCTSTGNCDTVIARNSYVGDPPYTWDLRLGRYFKISERVKVDLAIDVLNLFNRPNVDEVTSVYGSPVFCGAVPKRYKDSTTIGIQNGTASCAAQQVTGAPGNWLALGLLPVTIPAAPNSNFGLPRTVLNPRQMQFSAKLTF